ncbi:MAG: serine/threonine protein kinase [Verrucomicrobia bacterium]|nr:serine/threonine protein kinase [Verrucomicrobiota bacterium]
MPRPTCPECGSPLPSGVFGESCPKCQLQSALAPEPETPPLESPDAEARTTASELGSKTGPATSSTRFLGDYELLEEIGRGGMGVVFKARQIRLNRIVALKMTLGGALASPDSVQRLRVEAETVAQLRHDHIVAVHDIGEAEGRLFFSMDYVPGSSLAALAREKPLSARDAAVCLRTVAEAVAYAHAHGVVHRDLKPSNILIDEHGQPRITDFGLAKTLTREADLTATHQALGSPSFCAPEQAAGHREEIGPRSDIYSLGAILYFLLGGRPPLLADTLEQTLWQVLHAEPVSPRLLNHGVPVDLETICLKCLEKSPARRYATAQELGEELGRFLRGEPIRARPVSPVEKAWRWCRRKPVLATTAASVAALMVTVAAIIMVSSVRLTRKELALQYRAYAADMRSAQQALEAGNYGLTVHLLNQHRPKPGERDLRGWEWRYVRSQARPEALLRVGRHRMIVSTVVFSPDGTRLASGGSAGEVKLWDLAARREIAQRQLQGTVDVVAFSADGRLLASAGSDGQIRFWDGATLDELMEPFVVGGEVLALHFAQDGKTLRAVARDQNRGWMEAHAVTWDLARRQRVDEQKVRAWSCAAFSPDGSILATGGINGEIWLWDRAAKTELATWIAHPNSINVLVFSPDRQWLVSAGSDKTAKVWAVAGELASWREREGDSAPRLLPPNPRALQERAALVGSDATVGAAAFSPDGRFLATASSDQTLHLWDTSTWREVSLLKGNLSGISSVAFAPQEPFLATGGQGGEVRLWNPSVESRRSPFTRLDTGGQVVTVDTAALVLKLSSNLCLIDVSTGKELKRFDLTGIDAISFAASADARWVAAGTLAGELYLWDATRPRSADSLVRESEAATEELADQAVRAPSSAQPRRMPVDTSAISELEFSPDGKHLAAVIGDRLIALIEFSTGQTTSRLVPSTADAWKLAMQENGLAARSAVTGNVPRVRVLGETKFSVHLTWPGPMVPQRTDAPVTGVAFSSNGLLLAVGHKDGTAAVWDLSRKKMVRILKGHFIEVTELAFSPDGHRLAVSSGDGSVGVWEVASARRIASLTGTIGGLWSVSWSPDARRLATGTGESTILIWDPVSGQAITRLKGHAHSIVRARFLPDGDSLVSYAVGELFLWQAPPFQLTEGRLSSRPDSALHSSPSR